MNAEQIAKEILVDLFHRRYLSDAAELCSADAERIIADRIKPMVEDAERVSFVEAHPERYLRCHKRRWSFVGSVSHEYDVFRDMREAIDAAREEVGKRGDA